MADHPRSRGVYRSPPTFLRELIGSSPLARGLRPRIKSSRINFRIIPARAGFTASACRLVRLIPDHPRSRGVYRMVPRIMTGSRDHPRSRGVYQDPRSGRPSRAGSSPLARGLPDGAGPGLEPRGIIPARAGFTLMKLQTPEPIWDHPRSRGVYSSSSAIAGKITGSSPLARGLRHRGRR